jgi:hypothetical protein
MAGRPGAPPSGLSTTMAASTGVRDITTVFTRPPGSSRSWVWRKTMYQSEGR